METSTLRILDASLNRASEGLRVVEDYARFLLDDRGLAHLAKNLRHDLATVAAVLPHADLNAARETERDVGRDSVNLTEPYRRDAHDVAIAGLKRAQQALRTIEEFGKLFDRKFASRVERLRYRSYTLEKSLTATRSSNQRLVDAQLCVLIECADDHVDFEYLVSTLIEAGVQILQLRDKKRSDRELISHARDLVELTRGKCLAIINDRPDIAAATHADGVHLGQDDLEVKEARGIVGPHALIGVSTHNIEQARVAVLDGANYLGAGPTFPSRTKDFQSFAGLEYLRELAAEITLPTFAIGGIDAQNVSQVLETGVTRIAVSGAIVAAESPQAAAREILAELANYSTTTNG